MKKVKHIKRKNRLKNIYSVSLDDGSSIELSDEALLKYGLHVGSCATEENVNQAVEESRYFIYREKTYCYLEKTGKSLHEIKKYLASLGSDPDLSEKIIQEIKENHLVDEKLIIGNYIADSLSKKRGSLKIKYDLLARGFCEGDIDEFLRRVKDEIFIQNAFELARKKYASYEDKDKKSPGKLATYLFGQGYDENVVEKVVLALYDRLDS